MPPRLVETTEAVPLVRPLAPGALSVLPEMRWMRSW